MRDYNDDLDEAAVLRKRAALKGTGSTASKAFEAAAKRLDAAAAKKLKRVGVPRRRNANLTAGRNDYRRRS